jgi:hypothetical protein
MRSDDGQIQEELEQCRKLARARLAQTSTPKIVDMIVAEMMDSYRKQLYPAVEGAAVSTRVASSL